MKLLLVFLLGGIISVAVYFLITHNFFFKPFANSSNSINRSDWIAVIAIIVTLVVGFWQIKASIDEGTKQQKIEWLNKIHETVNGLRALRDELESNLKVYRDHIFPHKNLYVSGRSFHHAEYSTRTLDFSLERNAFEYDRGLFNRIMKVYAFFEEANRVFRQARVPVIAQQERAQFYTLIFSQHDANNDEWNKLIQDISKYANDYEPFASKASVNSFQAISYGTKMIAAIVPKNNKLFLMNVGGESASEIKITCVFFKSPESNKKFLLPFLSIRQPVEYSLDPPRYSDKNLSGQCKIAYKSEHTDGFKKISFDIEWDASSQQWLQRSNQDAISRGVLRSSLGSIDSISPYELRDPLPANLAVELNQEGTRLIIQNDGGTLASSIKVIREFGAIENWKDVSFQYILQPGEEISMSMPFQQKDGNSFGGKIFFQSEGSDKTNYKILSFKWDTSLQRWARSY